MEVSVNASVLSALFYEQLNCAGDQEGFLLGRIVNKITDTISDSHLNNIKEETVAYLQAFIPCSNVFSFYNSIGEIDLEQLSKILGGREKDVIGWYKFRRNSSLHVSARENAVHRNLAPLFPGSQSNHMLFLLMSKTHTSHFSTHSFEHVCLQCHERVFTPVSFRVNNLGHTTTNEYKDYRITQCAAGSESYSNVLLHFQPEFIERSGEIREVAYIRQVNATIQQKLAALCNDMIDSEEQIDKLQDEVTRLRSQLKPAKVPQKCAESLVDIHHGPCLKIPTTKSIPLEMDLQLLKPVPVSQEPSFSKTLTNSTILNDSPSESQSKKNPGHFDFLKDLVDQTKATISPSRILKSNTLPRMGHKSTKDIEVEEKRSQRQSSEPLDDNRDDEQMDIEMSSSPVF
ncbi:BRISC complex subunit Abraxas 2-like [Tubulanus polymorphus]|uniref:BRISC complex subunit Abraxas 2-like n=1 Tax=Tubulanus polymorphus TaxID=672921 RepID=UPI003DA1D81A